MDSQGVFHVVPRRAPDPEANTRTYSGTLEVDVTITMETKAPVGAEVMCEADFTASHNEASSQSVTDYEETAVAAGTPSGKSWSLPPGGGAVAPHSPSPETNTAGGTCKVLVPYSWALPQAGPDTGGNSLVGDLSLSILTTNKTTGAQIVWRTNQQAIPVTAFPDEGGTTKYAIKVTL